MAFEVPPPPHDWARSAGTGRPRPPLVALPHPRHHGVRGKSSNCPGCVANVDRRGTRERWRLPLGELSRPGAEVDVPAGVAHEGTEHDVATEWANLSERRLVGWGRAGDRGNQSSVAIELLPRGSVFEGIARRV